MIEHSLVHLPAGPKCEPLIRHLFDLGHFHEADDSNFVVKKAEWGEIQDLGLPDTLVKNAICSYQRMRGLVEDGDFGDVCYQRSVMETGCRCGLPDIMERRANLSEWPPACQKSVTTAHQIGSLRYSGSGSINEAWDYGITLWNEVSGVVLSRVSSFSSAKVRATANRESSGILAWSYLPNNNCNEFLRQSYNNRVSWSWRLLWSTICHEIGHAIGLSHGGRGIMQPANDSSITALGSWDIQQVVKRYGKPTEVPDPDPDPDPDPPSEKDYGILQWYSKDGKPAGEFDVMRRGFTPVEVVRNDI